MYTCILPADFYAGFLFITVFYKTFIGNYCLFFEIKNKICPRLTLVISVKLITVSIAIKSVLLYFTQHFVSEVQLSTRV